MPLALTGATGFIGQHLLRELSSAAIACACCCAGRLMCQHGPRAR